MSSSNSVAVRGESAPASMNQQHAGVVDLMLRGNLNNLSEAEIMQVYVARCDSMGIDARTKPFDLLKLNGSLQLYPNARLADQLIGKHGLSVEVLSEETVGELYRVRVKVSDGIRAVNASAALPVKGLQGEALGNAWMKCETKAVRRGVLRFCGLGAQSNPNLDEERRKLGLRRVHAVGADRGLKHDEIRAIAQESYAIESMTELDADDLAELSDAIEAQLALASDTDPGATDDEQIHVDPETGEILEATGSQGDMTTSELIDVWQPVIEAASSFDEMDAIANGMKEAGVKSEDHPELLRIFKSRLNNLKIEAAKVNRASQDQQARANASANASANAA